jgi:hypothetical protein
MDCTEKLHHCFPNLRMESNRDGYTTDAMRTKKLLIVDDEDVRRKYHVSANLQVVKAFFASS